MEIQPEVSPVMRSSRPEDESVASVALNATTYKILTDGLYQNKIRAIIRELSCNAYDAQKAAGTLDKPFQLYLPNSVEPNFRIRDFGTGLSEKSMRDVFAALMNSTKRDDNTLIGGFGLGSKTPFSYVDAYNIVSYYKDTKRTYTYFKENGIPILRLMATEDTEEPNGLEISFPVASPDYKRFRVEAEHTLKPFKGAGIPFEVFGVAEDFMVEDYPRDVTGDGWFISHSALVHKLTVRMGLVDYEVDMNALGYDYDQMQRIRIGLCLELPIGSCEPAVSRETLSMKDGTVSTIKGAIDRFLAELEAQLNAKVNEAANLNEARAIYRKLVVARYAPFRPLASLVKPKWRGREFKLTLQPHEYGVRLEKLLKYKRYDGQMATKLEPVGKFRPAMHVEPTDYREDYQDNPVVMKDAKFILCDYKSAEFRARTWLLNFGEENDTIYLITPSTYTEETGEVKVDSWGNKTKVVRQAPVTWKKFHSFLADSCLTFKGLRLASTLPKKEREKSAVVATKRTRKVEAKVSVLTSGGSWRETELDISTGGVYVPMRHGKADIVVWDEQGNKTSISPSSLANYLRAVNALLGTNHVVYGISKDSVMKKVAKTGGWTHVNDLFQQAFQSYMDRPDLGRALMYVHSGYDSNKQVLESLLHDYSKVLNHLPWNHKGPITDALNAHTDAIETVRKLDPDLNNVDSYNHVHHHVLEFAHFMTRIHFFPLDMYKWQQGDASAVSKRLGGFVNINESYPLLGCIERGSYRRGDEVYQKAMAEYMCLLDQSRNKKCDCK